VTVRVGLTLPSFVEDPEIPIAVALAAEAAGLDAVFVFDHLWRGDVRKRRPALECLALLGAIAAETTTIAVGTLVARATLRPAATLANGFATAQRVSGGRLIAGIGAGDSHSRAENEAFGLDFGTMSDRVGALHDAVRASRGGDYPVWVGGRAAQVREIVPLADGWNVWGGSAHDLARESRLVREIAPTATITWGGLVLLGEDAAAASAKADSRSLAPGVIVGGPERVAAELGAYVERGAEWVIAGPIDSSEPGNAAILGAVRGLLNG
jgi:alkanesulfonate monooxygenase SsuD/methylene tetrahydromethanopterin reductase-like flavin-dependent oxidoreductase (luciferase family)